MDYIDYIRKLASEHDGEKYLEDRFGEKHHAPESRLELMKAASADQDLLKIAAWAADDTSAMEMYLMLGGEFNKEAFGTPMFQPAQVPQAGAQQPGGSQAGGMKPPSMGSLSPAAPSMGGPKPQQPQQPNAGASPKIKVQSQPKGNGQQGVNVSVG